MKAGYSSNVMELDPALVTFSVQRLGAYAEVAFGGCLL